MTDGCVMPLTCWKQACTRFSGNMFLSKGKDTIGCEWNTQKIMTCFTIIPRQMRDQKSRREWLSYSSSTSLEVMELNTEHQSVKRKLWVNLIFSTSCPLFWTQAIAFNLKKKRVGYTIFTLSYKWDACRSSDSTWKPLLTAESAVHVEVTLLVNVTFWADVTCWVNVSWCNFLRCGKFLTWCDIFGWCNTQSHDHDHIYKVTGPVSGGVKVRENSHLETKTKCWLGLTLVRM